MDDKGQWAISLPLSLTLSQHTTQIYRGSPDTHRKRQEIYINPNTISEMSRIDHHILDDLLMVLGTIPTNFYVVCMLSEKIEVII